MKSTRDQQAGGEAPGRLFERASRTIYSFLFDPPARSTSRSANTGGDLVVRGSQFIDCFSKAGKLENRMLQRMEFEMVEEGAFREMATEVEFKVKAFFGDYTAKEFAPETSPVMIWDLEKKSADRRMQPDRPTAGR